MIVAVLDIILSLVITISAISDIRVSRVPNRVTYPAIAAGLALAPLAGLINDYHGGPLDAFFNSLFGFILGFGMMFFLYLWGGFGGGDVKLMGAIGALKGYPFVVYAAFYSAVIGAVYSLAIIIWRGKLKQTVFNVFHQLIAFVRPRSAFAIPLDKRDSFAIPFGFCICLGTLWAMLESIFNRSVMNLLLP